MRIRSFVDIALFFLRDNRRGTAKHGHARVKPAAINYYANLVLQQKLLHNSRVWFREEEKLSEAQIIHNLEYST